MGVTVQLLPSHLRALVDNRAELTLPFGREETIAAFLGRLFVAYPRLRRETTREDGELLPISGGARRPRGGRRPATIRSA